MYFLMDVPENVCRVGDRLDYEKLVDWFNELSKEGIEFVSFTFNGFGTDVRVICKK